MHLATQRISRDSLKLHMQTRHTRIHHTASMALCRPMLTDTKCWLIIRIGGFFFLKSDNSYMLSMLHCADDADVGSTVVSVQLMVAHSCGGSC